MPFGDQINAGLLRPDYSAIERAGQSAGAGYSAIGQGIENALGAYKDFRKEQKGMEKTIDQSELYIDAAMKIFPDLAPSLIDVKNTIQDKNNPLHKRFAAAESVQGLLNMGVEGMKSKAQQMDSLLAHNAKMAELQNAPLNIQTVFDSQGNEHQMVNRGGQLRPLKEVIGGMDPTLQNLPQDMLTEADFEADFEAGDQGMTPLPEMEGGVAGSIDLLLPPREAPIIMGVKTASQAKKPEQFSEPYTLLTEDGTPLMAQKNLNSGEVIIKNTPRAGTTWKVTTDRNGNTTVEQVAIGQGQGRQEQVAENAAALQNQTAELGVIAISDAVNELDKMLQGGDVVSTLSRVAASKLPTGSPARNFTLKVQALKDRIALGSLTELRSASPTGGALGQVSNAEGQRLENKFGVLTAEQKPETSKRVLRDIAITYAETIHGTDKQLAKALEEGKLTPQQVSEGKRLRDEMIERAMSGNITGLQDARAIGEPQPQAPLVTPRARNIVDQWKNR